MKNLLVITHCEHRLEPGGLYSGSPFVIEMDLINRQFGKVTVFAPPKKKPGAYPEKEYEKKDVSFIPAELPKGGNALAKISQPLKWILIAIKMRRAAKNADVVHIRCPGNLGFAGLFAFAFSKKKRFVKYAGQWRDHERELLSYRLQKTLIKGFFKNSLVTVYGEQNHGNGREPVFATTFHKKDIPKQEPIRQRGCRGKVKIITVARLEAYKNIEDILQALAGLPEKFELTIVGDGPCRKALEESARKKNIQKRVRFTGLLPIEKVRAEYAKHDLAVLASDSEGFPKVLIEAMIYGIPPVASDVGINKSILENRGLVFPAGNPEDLKNKLLKLAENKTLYASYSAAARRFAEKHSLEDLETLYKRIFRNHGITDEEKNKGNAGN